MGPYPWVYLCFALGRLPGEAAQKRSFGVDLRALLRVVGLGSEDHLEAPSGARLGMYLAEVPKNL